MTPSRFVRDDRGVVLISVVIAAVVLTVVVTGMLSAVADDFQLLQMQSDYLRARYAADGGAALVLALLAEGRIAEISAIPRTIDVGEGQATVRRTGLRGTFIEFQAVGQAGRGRVTLQMLVDREPPYYVRQWFEGP